MAASAHLRTPGRRVSYGVAAILRTLFLMLVAPPLALLLWAHLIRPAASDSDIIALFLAGIIGLAGAVTAPWSPKVKAAASIAYIAVGVMALPLLTLLAVCSTGDCL